MLSVISSHPLLFLPGVPDLPGVFLGPVVCLILQPVRLRLFQSPVSRHAADQQLLVFADQRRELENEE